MHARIPAWQFGTIESKLRYIGIDMADLPHAEAEPLIALRKVARGDLRLQPRRNHSGYLSAAVRAEDEADATIPGVTVELELKTPLLVESCKNIASIYLLRSGVKYRVYQIEVQPADKRSHNAPGNAIYGLHEHVAIEWQSMTAPRCRA